MNVVKKDREETKRMDKGGVYPIPFIGKSGERSNYIEMTERKLKFRKREHMFYITKGKDTTALAK